MITYRIILRVCLTVFDFLKIPSNRLFRTISQSEF